MIIKNKISIFFCFTDDSVEIFSFILLCHKERVKKAVSTLQLYGKMSLTNYLGQSIFGSLLFYHWGFELGRYLGITYSFLFGILFVILQMVFCSWWLRHHKHGPFEGLWKRLTWIGKNK